MRAGSKSARINPRLGLARLISAMTAGKPRATFARIALSNPRGGVASRARRRISAGSMRAFAAATSTRLASRMRVRTFDLSGCEATRELHELVELRARRAARDAVARDGDAIPEARRDTGYVKGGRGIEDHDVARGAGLVGEHGFDAGLRFGRVLHLDRLDGRHVEP